MYLQRTAACVVGTVVALVVLHLSGSSRSVASVLGIVLVAVRLAANGHVANNNSDWHWYSSALKDSGLAEDDSSKNHQHQDWD